MNDALMIMIVGLLAAGTLGGVLSNRLPMSGLMALGLSLLPVGGVALGAAFC
ncbi:MAG: hypothetical protein L0Y58_08435 [Verrucomicrobia subdivision 3 bacterium]|nr:hypothetical protein [Limisphaerales bacterium]